MRRSALSPARLPLGGLVGGVLLLLTGCTAGAALIPTDAGSAAGDTEAASLVVGDCIDAVDGDLAVGLDSVPCTEPHDWEVYTDLSVTDANVAAGDSAPNALIAAAEEGCGAAFLPFLGLGPAKTFSLGYTYLIVEDAAGIGPGDRHVHCLIGDLGGPVIGSLAGAAR
jgi:hypothetical protein